MPSAAWKSLSETASRLKSARKHWREASGKKPKRIRESRAAERLSTFAEEDGCGSAEKVLELNSVWEEHPG